MTTSHVHFKALTIFIHINRIWSCRLGLWVGIYLARLQFARIIFSRFNIFLLGLVSENIKQKMKI